MSGEKNPHLPWVEKYRPRHLSEVLCHKQHIQAFEKLVCNQQLPNLLLYGPSGTGKTSIVHALARHIHPKENDFRSHILELNASDQRGIDTIRTQIKDFASTSALTRINQLKLIVLDEADALTRDAQLALRRIMEDYMSSVRFCILCNHLNKVIPAIQSRCAALRFGPLGIPEMETKLKEIGCKEGSTMTEDGLQAILSLGKGDMRKSINLMQMCHLAHKGIITQEYVYRCAGKPTDAEINQIIQVCSMQPIHVAYKEIFQLQKDRGYSLQDIITQTTARLIKSTVAVDILGYLLSTFSDVEYRMARGCQESTQIGLFVGAFVLAKNQTQSSPSSSSNSQ